MSTSRDGRPEDASGSHEWAWGSQLPEDRDALARDRFPAGGRLGPYTVVDLLGQGSMGAVYLAGGPGEREVAIKVISAELSPRARERFLREGRLTAALRHPGIVRVHSASETDGVPYLVYELVDGARTLDEAWDQASLRQRVTWVRDAARALGHAHQQGVVHRDVKPSNMLVDAEGRLRVADFGLALGEDAGRLTQTGALVGTPGYMAPERIAGEPGRDAPAVDVWSLGVVLYEALTGAHPFPERTLTELAAAIVGGGVMPPRERVPDLPRELERITLQALSVDASRRFPDGAALASALEDWLEGEPAPTGSRALALALTACLLLAGVGLWGLVGSRPGERSASPRAEPVARPTPAGLAADPHAPGAGDLVEWVFATEHADTDCRALFVSRTQLCVRTGSSVALVDLATGDRRDWAGWSGLESQALLPDASGVLVAGARAVWCVSFAEREPRLLDGTLPGRLGGIAVAERNGRWLLAVGARERVRVSVLGRGPVEVGETILEQAFPAGEVLTQVGFVPDREELWLHVRGPDELRRFSLESGAARRSLELGTRGVSFAWFPAEQALAVGLQSGHLLLQTPAGVTSLGDPELEALGFGRAHESGVRGLAFSPDGRRLYSLGRGEGVSRIKAWSCRGTPRLEGRLDLPRSNGDDLTISPDGSYLVVGYDGGVFQVLSTEDVREP